MNLNNNTFPAKTAATGDSHRSQATSSMGTDGLQRTESDRHPNRAQPERRPKTDSGRAWGSSDPSQWVGKKVRSKKSGATYTIRNVFKNGRVELEKSWMTYSSDLRELQGGYEPCV